MIFDELYSKLNQQQKLAVDHIDGPMMVIAGAGTGKTQVLAMRIANLVRETGVGLHNILCLTFTDAGVSAMRDRLVRIMGSDGHSAKVCTFHSFANEVMADFPEKFIRNNELIQITELEKRRFMAKILSALAYGNPLKHSTNTNLYMNDILGRIAELKREGISPGQLDGFIQAQIAFTEATKDLFESILSTNAGLYSEAVLDKFAADLVNLSKSTAGSIYLYKSANLLLARAREEASINPTKTGKISYSRLKEDMKRFYNQVSGKIDKQQALSEIYKIYLNTLEENGRFDFEDMINNVLSLLGDEENVRRDFQEKYQYILVDEYQDTNTAQNKLVSLFGIDVDLPNIFVVGDDDQAIFRFQGASLENVVGFAQTYSGSVKIVSLLENYRSQPTVLKVADKLISYNQFRAAVALPNVVKSLKPGMEYEEDSVKIKRFMIVNEESYWIVKQIQQMLAQGVRGHEIAILAKTNNELLNLVPFLKKMNIPYTLSKSENAFENIIVQQFLRLLMAVNDPYQNENFFFLLESAVCGISPIEFLRINKFITTHPRKYFQYFDVIGDTDLLNEAGVIDTISCSALHQNILRWRELTGLASPMEVLSEIVSTSGVLDQCRVNGENELDNLRALGALVSEIGKLVQADRNIVFSELINTILEMLSHNIVLTLGDRGIVQDRVILSTVHKSKGLEFENVFVMNMIEKKWEKARIGDKLTLPLNLFENDLGVAARQEEEEARRLFYVAITRAKKCLTVSFAENDESGKAQKASKFITELGDDGVEEELVQVEVTEEKELLKMQLTGLKRPESYDDEVKNFLKDKLMNYSISASHLNAYLKCPRMFYYQYFIRAPIVPDVSLIIGTAGHKAVESLFESNKHGELLSPEQVIAVYKGALDRSWLTGSKYNDAIERGKYFLEKYYAHRVGTMPTNIKIEKDFSYLNICLDDIKLTGKMDMIELDERNRRCVIYDFKTGKSDYAAKKAVVGEEYWRQMVFYKLLTKLARNFGYAMERGILEFIEPADNGSFTTVEIAVSDDDLDVISGQIRSMWTGLKALEFRCYDPFGECKYCKNILKVGDGEGF